MTVGVRELKDHLSRYLETVKAGSEVTVTQHGRPVATLGPVNDAVDTRHALIEAGIIVPAQQERRLPERRVKMTSGPSIVDYVNDQRR